MTERVCARLRRTSPLRNIFGDCLRRMSNMMWLMPTPAHRERRWAYSLWCNGNMAGPLRNRTGRRHGVSTRERIVSAAEHLFDALGIGKVSVADIADYAGVHRVTVYRHFADREAILDEVLARRSQPVLDRAAARLASATRFPDDLAYMMVAAVDDTRQVPEMMKALAFVQDGGSLETRATSGRFLERAVDLLTPYLQTAQRSGQMRPELSVDDTVRWLLQAWLSMLFLAPDDSPAKMLDTCMTYVMPALLNRP
jgi:TetR/AcrR family transcriptional repressor of uid operon